MKYTITAVLIFVTFSCSAQSICEKLQNLKQKYYGFKPSDLTQKQQEEKSANLDKFWDLAKANKEQSAECLKNMILDDKNDSYFCYDASSLLLQIDDKKQYRDVILKGVEKSRLRDLVLESYLHMCFYLGKEGLDISILAEKLISEPNASVFLTAHVITLNAADASLFLYNVMGTSKAEKSLIGTITNGNPTGKHNAAIVLNMISTAKGDSVLNYMIANKQLADSTIKYILNDRKELNKNTACTSNMSRNDVLNYLKELSNKTGHSDTMIAGNDMFICSARKNLKPEDAELVRAARDKSTPGLSDESLDDYIVLTTILVTVRNK